LPLLLLLLALPARAAGPLPVTVNDGPVLEGQLLGSYTYLPLRTLCEALDCPDLTWDNGSRTASVTMSGRTVQLSPDRETFLLNGTAEPLSAPVLLRSGRLLVPLRSFLEAFAHTVRWDPAGAVSVYTDGSPRDDLYWMARIIQAESGLEPWAGKLAVGDVVMNRVADGSFPDTVHGVIFDDKFAIQFTPVANGTIYQPPGREAVRAAAACLAGTQRTGEALYFLNPALSSNFWIPENRRYLFTIGGHDFYA
jgi:N-acetylmuramoyl-L-alanine amidase